MTLRTIIVDDEHLARDLLEAVLSEDKEVEIVATCATGHEALLAVEKLEPDLLFLDVEMPEMTGLEVAMTLIERMDVADMPQIIFATAYDQYAVEAFRVNAVDYVLKPIDDNDIKNSLARVRRTLQGGHARTTTLNLRDSTNMAQMKLQDGEKIILISPDALVRVQAQGDYVTLYLGDRSRLIRSTLKALETRLPEEKFQRVHRSTIVNLAAIEEVIPAPKGAAVACLSDGSRISVSRSFTAALRKSLLS